MTPLAFELLYGESWKELGRGLDKWEGRTVRSKANDLPIPNADRLARLYRSACEQLALAQARSYPIWMIAHLEQLTARAHRLIYRRQDYGFAALRKLALVDIPESFRRHQRYFWLAVVLFLAPTVGIAWATWRDPTFALHVLDVHHLQEMRAMYDNSDQALGPGRGAAGDWSAFGFYILNNISIAFQCFAGGIFVCLGSAFFLVSNGVYSGAVAGYLIEQGLSLNFFSFVVTHSAFELTAICLSGAAGMRLGHALIAPGRLRRLDALGLAAREAVVLIYAAFGLLLIAAAFEAFWSSARWLPPSFKFGAGACAWLLVATYFGWQGRPTQWDSSAAGDETVHAH
jgi:uncharacterized membrane protein SpoIIM required for sporulation